MCDSVKRYYICVTFYNINYDSKLLQYLNLAKQLLWSFVFIQILFALLNEIGFVVMLFTKAAILHQFIKREDQRCIGSTTQQSNSARSQLCYQESLGTKENLDEWENRRDHQLIDKVFQKL